MKRSSLLQHLRRYGCVLKREGAAHALWTNPGTGAVEAVPRHTEIANTWLGRSAECCPFQNRAMGNFVVDWARGFARLALSRDRAQSGGYCPPA